jgi:hypothetical protein
MRIFVDCEFNGFGGELISMALVVDDSSYDNWYSALPLPEKIDPWVAENVIPVLHAEPISKEAFRSSAIAYLRQFDNPTICADWYTDLVHFFSLFAGESHAESVGYACTAELVLIDNYQSAIPHNALMDAMAIRDAWPSQARQSEAAQ